MESFKICPSCGDKFIKPKEYSPANWMRRVFCSMKCSSKPDTKNDLMISYLYEIRKMSSTEIGDAFNISGTQVLRILKRNNIDIRSASENKKLAISRPEVRKKMKKSATGRKLSEKSKDKLRERTGSKNSNWKNGLSVLASGYLYFTNSVANGEHANKTLHTIIAEWKIGRKLKSYECVHHKDRNKLNNDPSNLIVITKSDHAKLHTKDRENGKLK